ncbi:hypothetical protein L596_007591 [Steinernema carpocapsae]|uniref:Palmitoyltransferase n=1 Tax=Steinernema carpocapsae TaxID=34508 RepID=A0A4U5P9T0_STECR|nr:hypothetical protein L596_007591 [Steinernema carpocapsae]
MAAVCSRFFSFIERNKLTVYPCLNLLGVTYTLSMIVGLASVNIFHTCPALYGEEQCRTPIFVAAMMVFQICANLFLINYTMKINKVTYWTLNSSSLLPRSVKPAIEDACHAGDPLVGDLQPGKFCEECNMNVPKRSHHCPLCCVCVLRCDHHCFMTGACIGIGNQRYFVVFLAWVCMGAAYGLSYMFAYMNAFVAPNSRFGYLTYLAPFAMVQWIFGNESGFHVFLAVLLCVALSAQFAGVCFLCAQIFYISKGYSMWDYHHSRVKNNLKGDGRDLKERFELVFGRNWYLNFIFPQFWNKNVITEEIARNIFLMSSKDV